MSFYDFTTLDNGLRIIGQHMPALRSVSVGLWVDSGSIYETESEAGISHFIEHMLFKGTEKRTALRLAEEMDMLGGTMNAFTSVENTCFHAKVMDEHLPLAMDMIADIVLHSKLDEKDIKKEKGVVIEEINMNEDTPDDLVFDLIEQAHFGEQPVAKPVLGSEESVKALTRAQIKDYMARRYRPDGAVLALAGAYDWEKVVAQAKELYGSWQPTGEKSPEIRTVSCPKRVIRREKETEQTHICIGYDAPISGSDEKYAFNILNTVIGGGMSSRLFQLIREEKGMAYSVYSSVSTSKDSGLFTLYAGTSPENVKDVTRLMIDECEKIASEGITEKEFNMAKQQTIAQIAMSLESSSGNMLAIGRRMLMSGLTRTPDELIARMKAVTLDEVNALAGKYLTTGRSAAVVGAGTENVADEMILG